MHNNVFLMDMNLIRKISHGINTYGLALKAYQEAPIVERCVKQPTIIIGKIN